MNVGERGIVPGHRGLRAQVLVEVKKAQPITAKELAARFGVSPNAVRRHLKSLELEGLVRFGRERREVGAPAFAYLLTELGESLFPNGYLEALTELLDRVTEKDGREAVVEMFEERYAQLARRVTGETQNVPHERRLEAVARVLTEAGYMADWRASEGAFRLAEHNCAMRAVVERYPEICAVEERFLREVLGAVVERQSYIPTGCSSCEYVVNFGEADGCRTPRPEQV